MSEKKSNRSGSSRIDRFTAWGLAAGEHAFYAESLGQLYLFLTGAFLDHIKKDNIENALILNFHVGLKCAGTYDVRTENGRTKKSFSISLTNPDDPGLIQRIAERQKSSGRFTLAVCSAAVVVESYSHAETEMRQFMSRDYDPDNALDLRQLEVAVMKRLANLALTKKNLKLRVFHTAADLPLTAVYLKFSKPIAPRLPSDRARKGPDRGGKKIVELLATGLYEPRYATDVAQERRDINLPVQILVAGSSSSDSRIREQIKSLVDVYCKHIKQLAVPPKDPTAGPDTMHIFISHYSEDAGLAEALKNKIESFATSKDLRCKCTLGVGPEMSSPGQSFLANLNELIGLIDYAIVLHPRKKMTRHNIPYELGLFSQRFVTRNVSNVPISSRATLVAKPDDIVRDLSNLSGIPIVNRPGGRRDKVVNALFKELAEKIPFLRA